MSDLLKDTAVIKGISVRTLIKRAVEEKGFSNVDEIVNLRYNDWIKRGIIAVPGYIKDHALTYWSTSCATSSQPSLSE